MAHPNLSKLNSTTSLSPAEYERQKTGQQKAEDVIYTLNHAITCLSITDTIGMGVAGNLYKWVTGSKEKPKWSEHDHGHDHHDHGHDHHDHHGHGEAGHDHGQSKFGKIWHNAKDWIIGEAIGDLGAVPVTVLVQRWAPGFMDTLRAGMEHVLGGTFKRSSMRSAREWGAVRGFGEDSHEVVDRAQQLYSYEMRHMPQMAVWTVASFGLNYVTMKTRAHFGWANDSHMTPGNFLAGKAIGASITSVLVLGVRGATPAGAHKWDESVGKHVIVPITKKVGGLFGIKAEDVDRFHEKRSDLENTKARPLEAGDPKWTERTKKSPDAIESSPGLV